MRKIKAILLLGALLISGQASANEIVDIYDKYAAKHDNRTVIVVFHTNGNVNAAQANIIGLMKTRDPGGFFNPYWIVDIPDKGTNSKTGCGIIAGTWYASGFPVRGEWQNIMNNTSDFADLFSIGFSLSDKVGYGVTSEDKMKALLFDVCR